MIVFPVSKINLGLRITAKRSDGYHDIETIFYPVMLCDALELVVAKRQEGKDTLTTSGIDTGSDPEGNLIIITTRILREKYFFPFLDIHLHKAIPIGAGLGGGSSDAACLLKAINRVFQLNLSKDEIKTISLEIGSDCPFFIDDIPSLATGRGEILQHINPVLNGYYIILLNPGVEISTREAYQNCLPLTPTSSVGLLINRPITEWRGQMINDFEDFAFKKHPVIGEIKDELYKAGALFSLMSGSGSSVYGIFLEKPDLPERLKSYIIFEGLL
jgi:4-diphosphocytidyl-2-C-methyl-D-erythritol kinase